MHGRFAQGLVTIGAGGFVGLDKVCLQIRQISKCKDLVIQHIAIEHAARLVVDQNLFCQAIAAGHDAAAGQLAFCRQRVNQRAAVAGGIEFLQIDITCFHIDLYLREPTDIGQALGRWAMGGIGLNHHARIGKLAAVIIAIIRDIRNGNQLL